MNTITVYPVAGRLVRHPETGEPVPAAGAAVPRSPFWLRRLRDGDVTTARPAETSAGKESAKESK